MQKFESYLNNLKEIYFLSF